MAAHIVDNLTVKPAVVGVGSILVTHGDWYGKPAHVMTILSFPWYIVEVVNAIYVATYRTLTVYPKKYAHGFCFAVLCCGYTLTDFPISIRLTSLALWQSNDCPSASKATLMNMDKYFMWIHYERLHNHNKAKYNKTVCIFLAIYCNTRQRHLQCGSMMPYLWHVSLVRSNEFSSCVFQIVLFEFSIPVYKTNNES